jgi:hypothetical protein
MRFNLGRACPGYCGHRAGILRGGNAVIRIGPRVASGMVVVEAGRGHSLPQEEMGESLARTAPDHMLLRDQQRFTIGKAFHQIRGEPGNGQFAESHNSGRAAGAMARKAARYAPFNGPTATTTPVSPSRSLRQGAYSPGAQSAGNSQRPSRR